MEKKKNRISGINSSDAKDKICKKKKKKLIKNVNDKLNGKIAQFNNKENGRSIKR